MTEKKLHDQRHPDPRDGMPPRSGAARRLDHLIARASAALLWERLWRALLVPVLILGLFLCLSFGGVWLEIDGRWRMVGVGLLGIALAASLVPLIRLFLQGLPSRKEALARIDQASGLAHRPASGLDDTLANPGDDATTQALWALHRRRIEGTVAALRAGAPAPRMVDFDRYALRAAVLFALIACGFLAGPEKYARIAAAFDWNIAMADANGFRLDAWIDPPPYTGKAPTLLNVGASERKDPNTPVKVEAPIGSTIIVRASADTLRIETHGALEPVKADKTDKTDRNQAGKDAMGADKPTPAPAGVAAKPAAGSEQKLALRGDARLGLWRGNTLLGLFDIAAIPDKPPQIQLTDAPRANARGSLTLAYKISDDYGVTGATADFSKPSLDGENITTRSLVDPPRLTLNLGPGAGGLGEAETTGDLSDHPWAGMRVTMVLTARDEGGNEGKSDPIEIVLPEKTFTKPIARALAEQRRNLVLFPDNRNRVQTALEALMIAPDSFGTSAGVYLGLDVASKMLRKAQNDKDLLGVADYLWAMALDIENGSLTEAERDLRAAEQKLRDALQRNASDEEIAKLTRELRAAMDKFLQEFAEKQLREQGNQSAEREPNQGRTLSQKDLQSMLDRMQDMARSGDRADAQKMLEQLQNLLENLKTARRRNGDPARQQMNRALNQLDQMMRDQQELRDETHEGQNGEMNDEPNADQHGFNPQRRRGNNKRGGQQQGQRDHAGNQTLQERQRALRDELEQLQKQLRQNGQGKQGLDDAGKAMREAEEALGQGEEGREGAVDAQGRALEALGREAQNLAEQMQGEGQTGEGVGEEEGETGLSSQAHGSADSDPLGRPLSSDPLDPRARFDPMGVPAAQRAQRVLEELRRRLADPSRPREEMDYLERLLKRY